MRLLIQDLDPRTNIQDLYASCSNFCNGKEISAKMLNNEMKSKKDPPDEETKQENRRPERK